MSQELLSTLEVVVRIAIPSFLGVIFIVWLVDEIRK